MVAKWSKEYIDNMPQSLSFIKRKFLDSNSFLRYVLVPIWLSDT